MDHCEQSNPLYKKLQTIGVSEDVAKNVVPQVSTTVNAEILGLLQLLDAHHALNEITHEKDPMYAEQIAQTREKINICLRSHDYSLLLEYFMDKKFHELVDAPDLSQNRLLDLHHSEANFVKGIRNRRYELVLAKKDSSKKYEREMATLFGFDIDREFDWTEVLEVMHTCFKEVWGFEDHIFSIIAQELGEDEMEENGLRSPYYNEIRSITDPLALLSAMDEYYRQGKTAKNEGKKEESESFLLAAYEAQRIYALLAMFNLDQRSTERRRSVGVDEYFRAEYLDKVFRHEGVDQDTLLERIKKMREVYEIPINDDGSLKVWFTADKDRETGNASVKWDWENSPDFLETPEEVTVYPRFYFDVEKQKEVLCFCKTDIKSKRSTIEKEIRKQERLRKDINRMNLVVLTCEDKISPVNSAVQEAASGLNEEEVIRIFERIFPIETTEENFREDDFQVNPNTHQNYKSKSEIIKVPFRNQGDSRMEVRVHPTLADYLINLSEKHPAGCVQYSKRRVVKDVVPRVIPLKVYGEAILRRILHKTLHECARTEAKKFYRRSSLQGDLGI